MHIAAAPNLHSVVELSLPWALLLLDGFLLECLSFHKQCSIQRSYGEGHSFPQWAEVLVAAVGTVLMGTLCKEQTWFPSGGMARGSA